MKYITNLCTSYGHHMLLLLLFVLFSLQSYVLTPTCTCKKKKQQQQKSNQSEKLTVFLYTDEYTDRQTHFMQFISIVGFAIGFVSLIHMKRKVTCPLPYPSSSASLQHCCHLFPYRIHAKFLQVTGIITTYTLWITIRKEYYRPLSKCVIDIHLKFP